MIDFDFVKTILGLTLSSQEQTAVTNQVKARAKLDGVDLTYTLDGVAIGNYMANCLCVYFLAIGQSTSDKVGEVSSTRTNTQALANQYLNEYKSTAKKYFDNTVNYEPVNNTVPPVMIDGN